MEFTCNQNCVFNDLFDHSGIRDSRRFMHDQDWLKLGHMAHFGFLPNQEEDEGCCRTVQATHGLVGDVHNVSAVLHGLKQQLQTARYSCYSYKALKLSACLI